MNRDWFSEEQITPIFRVKPIVLVLLALFLLAGYWAYIWAYEMSGQLDTVCKVIRTIKPQTELEREARTTCEAHARAF